MENTRYSFRNGQTFSIEFDKIYRDFDLFTRAMIASGDDDPTYPMIRSIVNLYGYEPIWFAFVYHAFYSLNSAIQVCRKFPSAEDFDVKAFSKMREEHKYEFGYERRGLRGVYEQTKHLIAVKEFIANISDFMSNFKEFRKALEKLPNNGPWASFKMNEIMEKAYGFDNLAIPDIGIDHRDPNSDNDGPIPALRLMFGWDNHYSRDIIPVWEQFGVNLADAYGVSIGKIETCLCKFIKPFKGKYFIGHDIAEFQSLKETMGEKDWRIAMSENYHPSLWSKPMSKTQFAEANHYYQKCGVLLNDNFAANTRYINVLEVLTATI